MPPAHSSTSSGWAASASTSSDWLAGVPGGVTGRRRRRSASGARSSGTESEEGAGATPVRAPRFLRAAPTRPQADPGRCRPGRRALRPPHARPDARDRRRPRLSQPAVRRAPGVGRRRPRRAGRGRLVLPRRPLPRQKPQAAAGAPPGDDAALRRPAGVRGPGRRDRRLGRPRVHGQSPGPAGGRRRRRRSATASRSTSSWSAGSTAPPARRGSTQDVLDTPLFLNTRAHNADFFAGRKRLPPGRLLQAPAPTPGPLDRTTTAGPSAGSGATTTTTA